MRLRTKILLAIIGTLLISDLLGTYIVQDRFNVGGQREAADQAAARAGQVQALIDERVATLEKEGEAISLYPAVIQALVDGNPTPLLRWSGQVATLQTLSVTVTDATGKVVARGDAPDSRGDDLSPRLEGLRQALAGQRVSGAEDGDELGLALRGYVPVFHDGLSGPIVGTVMIAEPIDTFVNRVESRANSAMHLRVVPGAPAPTGQLCAPPSGAEAACSVPLISTSGAAVNQLMFTVPLAELQQAQADVQRLLWFAAVAVLVMGSGAAWLLARSLTGPLLKLMSASDRIGAGNLDQPVEDIRSSDEIGRLAVAFERMRGRVARATSELRDERDVLDAVLESAGDGILMVDERGETMVANRPWSRIVGADGLLAPADFRSVESPDENFTDAVVRWLADPDRIGVADFQRTEPYQRLRIYTAPVRQLGVVGRIFVLRDVTRETEAERMRSALVATVSHELRSPLTVISGYTDTLLHDGPWDDDTRREFLEGVAISASRLSGLVDNLLDAASLEAGVLRLTPEPVRIERIARRVVDQRRMISEKCTLQLEPDPDLPLVNADPLRIEQVLANLVDNAIKYSPDGGGIEVRIARVDDSLTVSVTDHGLGISAEHLPHLFDRFYRADSATRSRTIKGAGLGLFICRSLVEAHAGRIWVESRPGLGSTFVFTLPALVDELAEPSPSLSTAAVLA